MRVISVLMQDLLLRSVRVQNHAHEDLAPGWSEGMVGTVLTIIEQEDLASGW